jgi:hypothetical protein
MSEVCTSDPIPGHNASRYDHIWNALRHLEKKCHRSWKHKLTAPSPTV